MVNIYNDLKDEDGFVIDNRTKLFIRSADVDDHGNFNNFQSGLLFTPDTSGYFYIVDSWLLNQIEKIRINKGILTVKDGEEIVPPVKTDLEIQEEELEKQLAALRAKKEKNNIE